MTAYEMRISDWIQTCALPISAVRGRPGFCAGLGRRRRLCARRGLPGEVPSPCGPRSHGRRRAHRLHSFAWFSAPDLALTQLLVEIVTTVLLLLGLRWLPKRFELIAIDRFRAIGRAPA